MSESARGIFLTALGEAFDCEGVCAATCICERGLLRVTRGSLRSAGLFAGRGGFHRQGRTYDGRGSGAANRASQRWKGIVASSVEPSSQMRGFSLFSRRASDAERGIDSRGEGYFETAGCAERGIVGHFYD